MNVLEQMLKNEQEIAIFEKAEKQLHVFLHEVGELSKKRPNDPLNTFKLELVNGTLKTLNELLGTEKPFPGFELFDLDKLPSTSDVRFILAQYTASAYRYRVKNTKEGADYRWHWVLAGKLSKSTTEDPNEVKVGDM